MKNFTPHLTLVERFFLITLISLGAVFALMLKVRSAPVSMSGVNAVVNTLSDASDINPGDGICDSDGAVGSQCSLRAAIQEANAISGDDTISFDPSLSGAIAMSTALPDLNSSVSITGPGSSVLTVQRSGVGGTPNFRIFKIALGATVKISGLTIMNGNAGGATFETGSGGGIFNDGTLTVDGCNISGNFASFGGGVANHGSLTILNSTIANNTTTGNGGGVGNSFTDGGTRLRIDRSTVANNVSNGMGGGIYYAGSPLTLITNTTISSNSAATGGGIVNTGPLNVSNVTITANNASVRGGGIQSSGTVLRFNNTIIAGNTSPSGPDCEGSGFFSEDYNLIGNTNGFQLNGIVVHNINNVNPRLGPLANNGGATQTHQLLDGSPAIDAGSSTLLTDQRGFPRQVDRLDVTNAIGGDASDIGAYEAATFEVNSSADTNDGACTLPGTGNGCTLREAINGANATPGIQAITFAPALTVNGPTAITLLTALPQIASDMSITGPGADLLTVQRGGGAPEFRIFTINSGRSATIANMTIANGKLTPFGNNGGGVANSGTLTMANCNLFGNQIGLAGVRGLGGAIYNDGPSLTLINCKVGGLGPDQPNSAGASGGGIFNNSGILLVKGGSIVGNTGDGIASLATTTLDGVAITNNVENGNGGGGVLVIGGTTKIINSLIANNTASGGFGGGLRTGQATTTVVNTTVSGNTSISSGGGVENFNGSLTLINVTVTNNRSDSDNNSNGQENGGGVKASGGPLVLHNTIVAGNFTGAGSVLNDLADGVVSSSSFNVIGVCVFCGLTNGVNNNQIGVSNAGLGPLANNGGPTLTHALLPASPALDAGSNSLVLNPPFAGPPFTDQRGTGFNRIVDGPDGDATAAVDAGAFEQQVPVLQIENANTKEDTQIAIPFDVGDRSSITAMTVSSANETLLPNDLSHLRLTDAGTTELITINPAADESGSAEVAVSVIRGSTSESRTFTVTVDPVNDAPTFTRGVTQNLDEDSGAQIISNWATNISAGPADESGQSVSFQITGNTNPSLFSVAPSISPTGTLSYTLAPNANGVALITVVLKDNGGTANGGEDTSKPQLFGITVNAVNDAPVNVIPLPQSVIENGSLTFSSANSNAISITDIDAGNAPLQVTLSTTNGLITLGSTTGLSFRAGNGTDNATMTFSGTIPNINAALNGTRFTPTRGFDGPATIQITTNDGGNTGLGGPLSDSDSILVTVLDGGTLQFLTPSQTVAEGVATATIMVTRMGGNAGATSVTYSTSSGTAIGGGTCTAGIDYIDTSGTLAWAPGETTAKTFVITICNDSQNEEDEVLNLALSGVQGSGQSGTPGLATLILANDDAPVLLTEENTERAIALDSVVQTRDPFSLLNPFNLSDDHRRRVSLFVWRLGLLSTDNESNLTVVAEDSIGMTYPLTVERVASVPDIAGVSQVIVLLPDNVIGAPRDLWLTVKLRGPASNRAFIRIAAP